MSDRDRGFLDAANELIELAERLRSLQQEMGRNLQDERDRPSDSKPRSAELESARRQNHDIATKLDQLIPRLENDVTEFQRIGREARTDALTGLPNRRALNERFSANDAPDGSQAHLPVAIVDVDRFKIVNDQFGHLVGDQVLISIAKILQRRFRDDSFVARLGGDEFVIVIGDDVTRCLDRVEAARREIAETSAQLGTKDDPQPGVATEVSVSIGIGTTSSPDDPFEAALRSADRALLEAKRGGRNRTFLADKDGIRPTERP